MIYSYRVVKENYATGERGKRTRTITRYTPLKINGLYCHLGNEFKGFWRVLELITTEQDQEIERGEMNDLCQN